jgi:type II secretory pathway pseudopilin PulG
MRRANTSLGFSLIEAVTVIALIGIIAAVAGVQLGEWLEHQRSKSAARAAGDAFLLARSEAIRTGRNHIVFFGPPGSTDPAGTALTGAGGEVVPLLILDDGPPQTANCRIDGGEPRETVQPQEGVSWGVTEATVWVPGDRGAAPFSPPQASGSTFADPSNNPVNWVLFRPDGVPVGFAYAAGACAAISGTGRGGGALYLTSGERDYAIVLSPLGGVRVHLWASNGAWSS